MTKQEIIESITKQLVDQGLLIESGWQTLRLLSVSPNAPPLQLEEMRNAFFAGAQHLFASVINMLDVEAEITETDIRRFDAIAKELEKFYNEYTTKHGVNK